jgi:hypothetical protein
MIHVDAFQRESHEATQHLHAASLIAEKFRAHALSKSISIKAIEVDEALKDEFVLILE